MTHACTDRLPPSPLDQPDDAQRAAADELIAGPRKGVKGPFIPLLRSPELLARVQKVGEYLRFHSALSPRVSEFATLVVARRVDTAVRVGRARAARVEAGTRPETSRRCAKAGRPDGMSDEEAACTTSRRAAGAATA